MAPLPLELLAPARDLRTAMAAIDCGADAVYIGGPHHGARASAANSIEDIRTLCEYAHRFRVKVYVTLNTIIYNDETELVRDTICALYRCGVDALIVQDLGILRMNIHPIALHASTQCDARTPARAKFLQDLGMSCIVLPRELSLDEIREMRKTVDVRLEGFVHGALCVSYSGDCRASYVNGGRSANRGECAQICRMPFNLCDGEGNVLVADSHLLSLKDMNRFDRLSEMADAGISVFKIEGRLKSIEYVRTTVSAYSQALNTLCTAQPERYCRASFGRPSETIHADVSKAFNRGFTTYFLDGVKTVFNNPIAMPLTPKWVGPEVATVIRATPTYLICRLTDSLNNGDGLGYFDTSGKFTGFRLNRIDGNRLYPASRLKITPGTVLYRNHDKAYDDYISQIDIHRKIRVDMTLSYSRGQIVLTLADERGCRCSAAVDCENQVANTPQKQQHLRVLSKLGDTIYVAGNIVDNASETFVPASGLTSLRRDAIAMLDRTAEATYTYHYRRPEQKDTVWPEGTHLTFHQNVANDLVEQLYRDHNVTSVERAIEVEKKPVEGEVHVMTTRHCIRRQLGACLKTDGAKKLPSALILTPTRPDSTLRPMRLTFDCPNCQMLIHALPRQHPSS